jgi:hypothetical protein
MEVQGEARRAGVREAVKWPRETIRERNVYDEGVNVGNHVIWGWHGLLPKVMQACPRGVENDREDGTAVLT